MKKTIIGLGVLIVSAFCFLNNVSAAETMTIGSASVYPGSTKSLAVKPTSTGAISGGTFYISSDSKYVTVTSVTPVSGFMNMGSASSAAIVPQTGGKTISSGSVLFYIKIKVSSNAPEGTKANISVKNATVTVGEESHYLSDASGVITVLKAKEATSKKETVSSSTSTTPKEDSTSTAVANATLAVEKAEATLLSADLDTATQLVNALGNTITKENLLGRLKLVEYKIQVEANKVECQVCKNNNIWIYISMTLILLSIFEALYIILDRRKH